MWNITQPLKNEILLPVTTWMDLEHVMLNEMSDRKDKNHHMVLLMCGI